MPNYSDKDIADLEAKLEEARRREQEIKNDNYVEAKNRENDVKAEKLKRELAEVESRINYLTSVATQQNSPSDNDESANEVSTPASGSKYPSFGEQVDDTEGDN